MLVLQSLVLAGMELENLIVKVLRLHLSQRVSKGKVLAMWLCCGWRNFGRVCSRTYENNSSALSSMGAASAMLFLSALMLTWLLPYGIRSRGADTSAQVCETPRSDDNTKIVFMVTKL